MKALVHYIGGPASGQVRSIYLQPETDRNQRIGLLVDDNDSHDYKLMLVRDTWYMISYDEVLNG